MQLLGVVSRHRTGFQARREVHRRNRMFKHPQGLWFSLFVDVMAGLGATNTSPRRENPPFAALYSPTPDGSAGAWAVIATEDGADARRHIRRDTRTERWGNLVALCMVAFMLLDHTSVGVQVGGLWTFLRQAAGAVTTPGAGYSTFGIDSTSKLAFTKDDAGNTSYYRPGGTNTMVNALDPTYGVDNTGVTNTTTALQAAINAVVPGGWLWIPPGTYRIDGTLTLTTYHIQIVGASRADCVFTTNNATNTMVNMNSWYCSVQNIYFQTTATRTGGYCITMADGNSRHLAFNCQFDSHFNGIQLRSHLSFIDLCEFRTFAAGGSWIEVSCLASNAHDNQISRLDCDNGSNLAGSAGILATQYGSLLLNSCSLSNCGANGALQIAPANAQVCPSLKATNVFFDRSGYGVNVANTAGTVQRTTFTNCWFTSSTNAGALLAQTNNQSMIFDACELCQNVVGLDATGGNWQVANSTIAGNTTAGIRTAAAAGHRFSIQGNNIGNAAGFGGNALGIQVQAGTYAEYMIVDNYNMASNTTIPSLVDLGTASGQKIVANNSGAQMVAGGQTNLTASAALAATPGNVPIKLAIPAGELAVGTQFRIEAFGQNTATAAGSVQGIVRLGTAGTTADTAILTPAAVGAVTALTTFRFTALVTVIAIGASPTAICSTETVDGATVALGTTTTPTAIGSYNTNTQAGFLDLNLIIAGTSPTGTIYNAAIEVVKP